MDTRFWGPSGWRLLHLIAQAAPNKHIYDFFDNLPYILPCKFCRASLTDYYAADPMPRDLRAFSQWMYRIHNRVNGKLREQKLLETDDPKWNDIKSQYAALIAAPCTKRRMVGWDFLFSVAYTTPLASMHSTPMPDAPPLASLHTPELRNRWGVMSRAERIPYIEKWWRVLPLVLPFAEWRAAWKKHVPAAPSLHNGRQAVTKWLYAAEKSMCTALKEEAPHNSYNGLCAELHTFSSGCGKTRNLKMNTCRAVKSTARKTLKHRRRSKYHATGGYL